MHVQTRMSVKTIATQTAYTVSFGVESSLRSLPNAHHSQLRV
jgi:hypothetical protein